MKQNKGITLISLVIAILVMLILAGISVTAGGDALQTSQRVAKITELEMIAAKVNVISEKRKNQPDEKEYYDALGEEISKVPEPVLTTVLQGREPKGYRYFSKENLQQLELTGMKQDVIIHFDTKDVATLEGITIDENTYYRLSEIPGYVYEVKAEEKTSNPPTFRLEVTTLPSSWRILLKDIQYDDPARNGQVSYKRQADSNWILMGNKTVFEVTKPGMYDIRLTDDRGNQTIMKLEIQEEKNSKQEENILKMKEN